MNDALRSDSAIWIKCDGCGRIAGMNLVQPEWDRLLLASAGEVTQIRKGGPLFLCGGGRCNVTYEHPLACSDDCERRILQAAGLPTDRVGLEDADLLDLAAVAEESAALAQFGGDNNTGRMRLLLLKRAGLPLKATAIARLATGPEDEP